MRKVSISPTQTFQVCQQQTEKHKVVEDMLHLTLTSLAQTYRLKPTGETLGSQTNFSSFVTFSCKMQKIQQSVIRHSIVDSNHQLPQALL